jgi:putative glycosyltransferase (TIGR04372 family)
MNHQIFGTGTDRILVSRPNNTAYGHLILDILMSLHIASAQRSKAHFIRPRRPLNSALFEFRADEVEIVGRTAATSILEGLWLLRHSGNVTLRSLTLLGERISRKWGNILGMLNKKARTWVKSRRFPGRFRASANLRLEGWARELAKKKAAVTVRPRFDFYGLDFRRLYAKDPIRIFLPEPLRQEAIAQAKKIGLMPTTKIVTLHVRDSGYKSSGGVQEERGDSTRNAGIESYTAALDLLATQGYTVVRLGDPRMTPVRHPAVLDLATSRFRTDLLELWCVLSSRFFIGCDSGPICLSLLGNIPSLQLNVFELISSYPLREADMYILRRPIDKRTGRQLSLEEMTTEEYVLSYRKSPHYDFPENNRDEIYSAVKEMLEGLANKPTETIAQREFKTRMSRLQDVQKIRDKWVSVGFPERPYLGDGRIADFFAERYLRSGSAELALK